VIINAANIGEIFSGIGRYSLSLSSYLLEYWDYPFQLFINGKASGHFEKTSEREKAKIKIVSKCVSPDFGLHGNLLRLLWTNKLCLQNQKEIIFNTSQLEASLFHNKQIMTVHDLIPLLFPHYHKKQLYYFKHVFPIVLKKSIAILTVSHHSKNLIVDFYKIPKEKVIVIYNGISELFLNCKFNPKKQNYILYVGRISPTKNIEGLVKAFEMLITAYKLDLRLKITDSQSKLNFKISMTLRDKIDFVGNIPDSDLRDLYKNASLFVFPSLYEGFGLPPLEAMACGCPVVCSNVASLPEVCGEAACYVDPVNIESIVEGMYKVLTDEDLRQNLIQKGLQRAKLFSWEKSAREHIRVFEELLF
jgi:glycosyltransferase involved in cell wall biosynthesis